MKSIFAKKPTPDPELLELKAELRSAQSDLNMAYCRFNQAVDPELVEASIYEISAVKARCNYLIRIIKARESGAAATAGIPAVPAQSFSEKQSASGARAFSPAVESVYCEAHEDEGGAVWT